MRIIKGIKVILFVILFILMNLLLSYFLVKANGPSEVMWKDFRKTEKIDTVYLGSSFSQMTFNPYMKIPDGILLIWERRGSHWIRPKKH